METLQGLGQGFSFMLSPYNLIFCAFAAVIGVFLGFLPGMNASVVAMLALPLTFALLPSSAFMVLVSLCFGTRYGRAAMAFHCWGNPGASGSETSTFAIAPIALAAFFASTVVAMLVAGLVPLARQIVLALGPAEYAALTVALLVTAAAIVPGSMVKALGVILIGLLLSVIGRDLDAALKLVSFGHLKLPDGIGLLPLTVGIFLVPAMLSRLGRRPADPPAMSAGAKRNHRDLALATAAANAGMSASLLPLLILGLSLNAMAVILAGLLTIQEIVPRPQVGTTHPEAFWGLFAAIIFANVVSFSVLFMPRGVFALLCRMNGRIGAGTVLVLACLVVYNIDHEPTDLVLMIVLGGLSALLLSSDLERGLLLTSFILGPALPVNIERAMTIARGDVWTSFGRLSVAVLLIAALVVAGVIRIWRRNRVAR